MAKIKISFLLVAASVSISSAIQVSKDSVDFTDTTDYFCFKNSGSAAVTIDSITIKFFTGLFRGGQFMIDTGIAKHHLFYGDIQYMMLPTTDSEMQVVNMQEKMTVKSKDSLRINAVSLGSCWGCLGKRLVVPPPKDTVLLTFKDSNSGVCSITAVVPMLYGSHVVQGRAAIKNTVGNPSPKAAVLANGRQISKNGQTAKNIKKILAIDK